MADFDKLAAIYDATRSLPEDMMEKIVSQISEVLRKNECESIVDVGVGTGRFALPLSRNGFRIVGIDISREMLKIARGKKLDDIFLADGNAIPFSGKAFDAATAIHVLHIAAEWRSLLKEISRVTKNILISSGTEIEGPSMRREYFELRQEMDHSYKERGLTGGENVFATIIQPAQTTIVIEEIQSLNADEEIGFLERRGMSMTLYTPEKTHRDIIDRLKSSYSGKTLQRTRKELVYVWRVESLTKTW